MPVELARDRGRRGGLRPRPCAKAGLLSARGHLSSQVRTDVFMDFVILSYCLLGVDRLVDRFLI